jgi:hypothetical protein
MPKVIFSKPNRYYLHKTLIRRGRLRKNVEITILKGSKLLFKKRNKNCLIGQDIFGYEIG